VKEVSCNSVKLAWNSTSNVTTAPVRSYVIQYRRNDSDDDYVEMSVRRTEVTVTDLNADTTYEFHVFAVSDDGRSLTATSTVINTSYAGAVNLLLFHFSLSVLYSVIAIPARESITAFWLVYFLVTEARVCEQIDRSRYLAVKRPAVRLAASQLLVRYPNHCTTKPQIG